MNKNDFLKQLENLLSDLPTEERKEAMEYYVEYFEEAGPDKEEDVIKELGSPKEVAHNIHKELEDKGLIPVKTEEKRKSPDNGWQIAFIVLLCLIASPVVIPLGFAFLGVIFGLLIAVIAIVFSVIVTVVAIVFTCAVLAVVLFFLGIVKLFSAPLVAMLLIGISFICAGLFILSGYCMIKLCSVVLPALFKGIINMVGMPFRKKEVAK